MNLKSKARSAASRAALVLALGAGGAVSIVDVASAQNAVSTLEEEIVVTARKRGEENVQDVPIAVTAFSENTLDALNFHDLSSLSYTVPNVSLEDIGTTPGVANFTIRGIGINSSIISIDPAVGVFVDGVYIGNNAGVVLENWDIGGIEVLRGPQGTLYGRNVTGGAILLNTTDPTNELEGTFRVSAETGDNYTLAGRISGPLIENVLNAKLAVFHNDDGGWFENRFDGEQFGAAEQTVVRAAFTLTPVENLELVLKLEHGEASGDGPAGQNHALFSRDSFDFSIDHRGFYDNFWDQAILEGNLDVGFGDGTITSVTGWRQYSSLVSSDIDGTPNNAFIGTGDSEQEQWSQELRYAGTFGNLDVTTGAYYFVQTLKNLEGRVLFGGLQQLYGGGDGEFSTWAGFINADYHLTPQLTLNVGTRYSHEEKEADISVLRTGGGNPATGELNINIPDVQDSWNDLSPRVGLQWQPSDETQLYAYWAQGFRSGGINFRNTIAVLSPNQFDSEEQTTIEFGLKHDLNDAVRLNLAVFQNEITGMQREINTAAGPGAIAQLIRNVGDATVQGAEIEARFLISDSLMITVMGGYTEGEYENLTFDLNGDGFIGNAADYALVIPRLAPWTYGASVVWDTPVADWAGLSTRVSWNHRDASFFTDNNLGRLNEADMIDVDFTLTPNGSDLSFSFYGRNLLDEVTFGGDTQLPDAAAFPGSLFGGDGAGPLRPTFSPLSKGRVFGVEVSYDF